MSIADLLEITSQQASSERKASIFFIKDYGEQFFTDGQRIIDYILVYKFESKSHNRRNYLRGLQQVGIELEEATSRIDPSLRFIKLHVPKDIILKYAEKLDIPLKKLQKQYIRPPIPKFKFMRTELTSQDRNSPNYDRAVETFSMDQPKRTLRNERILVTYNILKRVVFGPNPTTNIGIHHLLERDDDLLAAYPPHDGPSTWTSYAADPLNDRQLLRRYWASPKNFFKAQPLDVIERYFGDNIALYFAWLSFYNRMLILPTITGCVVTILNILMPPNILTTTCACSSNKLMCPRCKNCPALTLSYSSCQRYKITRHIDSFYTIAFSFFMCIWAAIYVVLWRRRQAVYDVRWDIRDSIYEEQDNRPEFENIAKHVRLSEFKEPELYIPFYIKLWRKIISIFICAIIAYSVGLIHFLILEYQSRLGAAMNYSIFASISGALLTVTVIVIMRRVCISVYEPLVNWLVNLELPKTQTEFDNSYIIKIFVFSFINNYFGLIYTAYFKGKLYTHPEDERIHTSILQITRETCDPSGCTTDIFFDLMLLMILIPLLTHLVNYTFMFAKIGSSRLKEKKAKVVHESLPRWEKDYQLIKSRPQQLLILYEENVVEFGFVTLFAFAFPAAPLFALLNNFIKIHIDAHNLVVRYQRPQAKRTASVGAWLDVTNFITYLSIFTNALYMMFTSNLMTYFYILSSGEDMSMLNYTISRSVVNLDHYPYAGVPNGTTCYYPGSRYPPDHPRAYQNTEDYYFLTFQKTIFILLFEHAIWILTLWISYSIPSIPNFIRDKFATETMELRRYLNRRPNQEPVTIKENKS